MKIESIAWFALIVLMLMLMPTSTSTLTDSLSVAIGVGRRKPNRHEMQESELDCAFVMGN
jgi:hypothetical protein